MKIKRTIDGVKHEFELTTEELAEAYTEVQHQFDCDDVSDVLARMMADNDLEDYESKLTTAEIYELVPRMAKQMRRDIDKYSDDWWHYGEYAVVSVLDEPHENTDGDERPE